MDNLYYIKDKEGKRVKFKMNWAQSELWLDPHPCKLVLKARQLGITTYFCLLLLDKVLWQDNVSCGIIAHTLADASNIFQDKLKYAFDHIHPALRPDFKLKGDSAKELSFEHGSVIRVGTSLRSSTLNYLHITELGKICATMPEKAREIVTGALQTVTTGQHIYIESTAEGREGFYYDLCQKSERLDRSKLTPLDYSFHFFPWHKESAYSMGIHVPIPQDTKEYFDKLFLNGIELSDPQKWWYTKKTETLREDMAREYPSTPEEAFSASQEGFWYASYMKEIWDAGHITNVSYDRALPVYCSWDLGQADSTSIWFFQLPRSGDINLIDYWERTNTPLDQVVIMLKEKQYNYGTHIWPHDANARDRAGITFVQQARALGLTGFVLDPHSLLQGINQVRTMLSKCWFDRTKCAKGLKHIESYKKRWSSSLGGWTSEAVHDDASHCCDSLRYACAGIDRLSGSTQRPEDAAAITRRFFGG